MPFDPPRSLSPSKITAFRDCALSFRFSAIDHLPDPPTAWTVKGTLVHSVLERLFWHHEPGSRTIEAARAELEHAWGLLRSDDEYRGLGLDDTEARAFVLDASVLVENYFRIEDPNAVRAVGIELMVEADVDGVRLRGIIDRLDLTDNGDLIVIDYKTGRAPSAAYEATKMNGVHLYALLCQERLGRRPIQVRLLHLREPAVITAHPTDQTLRGHRRKAVAVWTAIERACADEDFRPRVSPLCRFCAFRPYCPAQGGDLGLAVNREAIRAASQDARLPDPGPNRANPIPAQALPADRRINGTNEIDGTNAVQPLGGRE
ncbi:MAG: RecB family exonuclease [Acidimicrobiales bacterium]